jgi:hypothetical protein
MSAPNLPSCIIFLDGYPGVGKQTIARAMQSSLQIYHPMNAEPDAQLNTRLITYHDLNSAADAIIPTQGEGSRLLRAQFRDLAFHALEVELQLHPELVVIMTGFLTTCQEDQDFLADILRVAHRQRRPLFYWNILCDREEHLLRYQQGPRRWGDIDNIHGFLDNYELRSGIPFAEQSDGERLREATFIRRRLDTTGSQVGDSVQKILGVVRSAGVDPALRRIWG